MFTHLREDYRSHREGVLAQGFWALSFYRFGRARLGCRFRPLRVVWAGFYVLLSKLSQALFGIQIGMNATIGRRVAIEHFGCIVIHNDAVIGDDVVIRQGVTIGNRRLDQPREVPKIGNRVNIGAGAKLLGAITIGDDVNIGANAVVLCDVPSGCVAVGVPAIVSSRRNNSEEC